MAAVEISVTSQREFAADDIITEARLLQTSQVPASNAITSRSIESSLFTGRSYTARRITGKKYIYLSKPWALLFPIFSLSPTPTTSDLHR